MQEVRGVKTAWQSRCVIVQYDSHPKPVERNMRLSNRMGAYGCRVTDSVLSVTAGGGGGSIAATAACVQTTGGAVGLLVRDLTVSV